MTLSVGLGSSKSVGQQVCGLCSVEVGCEPPPNYVGNAEADSMVVVATSELFGNSWKGSLLVESPSNLWKQNEPHIQRENEGYYTGGRLGRHDNTTTGSLPLCQVETSTGIGALATVKMGSRNVSGHVV